MEKVPKQLILEVTNRCNLECKFCPNVCNDSFHVGDMDLGFFRGLVDTATREMPDAVIIPWMNGEPMLHPDYFRMVEYLSLKGRRFYVTTNATVWKEELFRELFRPNSGCYQLIVSLDGLWGTGSVAAARPGSNEEQIRANLDRILRLHGEMDSTVDLAVKICERGQDWAEIEEYVQYWLDDAEIDFVVVGKALKGENEVSMRRSPCQYFDRNFMVVRWDGTLVPCAYNDAVANKGYLRYGKIGAGDSLLEAYNNEEITELREMQDKGKFAYPCRNCSFAYTGGGFQGTVAFRNRPGEMLYFHQDYYNSFFSRVQKWKEAAYYAGEKR